MTDALQLRDNARYQLEQIRDLESGIEYLNKVKAIEVWAKAEQKDAELQNMVAEQKIRTQRILGQLIKEGQESGELAKMGENGSNLVVNGDKVKKTLSEIGITRDQSSAFKAIASIPEQTFEDYIAEKKQAVNDAVAELTTTGAVRLAKSLKQTSIKLKDHANEDFESIVSELIQRINELPPIYRLKVKQGIRRG